VLAVLTSHPIQYQVPLWRGLAEAGLPLEVWFLTNHGLRDSHDPGFGRSFAWDLDMLGGYPSRFLDVEPNWNLNRFQGIKLRESLAERLRAERVRALWIEGWRFQANWQALRAARRVGTRVWLRGESNDLRHVGRMKSMVKRPLLSQFFRRVDEFLCIGSANRRLYESYGVPRAKFKSAPYCVDNDRFHGEAQQLEQARPAIRERWRIAPNAYCVLFCGKFIPKKRPHDLIQAAHKLMSAGMDAIHLLFVGEGELGAELRSACHVVCDGEKHVEHIGAVPHGKPRASFVGFLNQSEIAQAYVAADLLVLPSDSGETWGLVVNEAMACGTPAVVSDRCGCAEDLAEPLDRRLVYRCGDVDALATAINHARQSDFLTERVREVVDTHHLRNTVNTVAELYHAICRC
jgi:glycosyltransferase involved in cell wall biosynthesis